MFFFSRNSRISAFNHLILNDELKYRLLVPIYWDSCSSWNYEYDKRLFLQLLNKTNVHPSGLKHAFIPDSCIRFEGAPNRSGAINAFCGPWRPSSRRPTTTPTPSTRPNWWPSGTASSQTTPSPQGWQNSGRTLGSKEKILKQISVAWDFLA